MTRAPRIRRLVRSRLRLRALLATVGVTLVALVAFDFVAVTALRSYLLDQTDTLLRANAAANAALLAPVPVPVLHAYASAGTKPAEPLPIGARTLFEVAAPINRMMIGHYEVAYLSDDANRVVAVAPDAPVVSPMYYGTIDDGIPADWRVLSTGGGAQTATSADGKHQVRTVATPAPGGSVVVSATLDEVDDTVDRMRHILLIGSAAAVLLIGLGVFWLLRRGLRPIETMAGQADLITAGNLTDRVAEQDPRSEVGRLGTALNGMLARIETSVQEQEAGQELMRRFFADASHELRNPLASLRANAELYQQGALAEPPQVDEVMRRIGLETRRMSGLVDDMLRLARLDQHPERRREPLALSDLVAGSVAGMRVAVPDRDWHAEIDAGVVVVGDPELLRRAVDNLLANVVAHTAADTSATVLVRQRPDAVEIEVADTGPGVPDDALPRLFDRFYRAGGSTSRPGSGLGLAIVSEIAAVHNGTAVAEPNAPHGLRVRLTLPLTEQRGSTRNSHGSPAAV